MPPLQPVAHTPAVCPTPPPPACFPSRPSSILGSSDREREFHKIGSAGKENQHSCSTPCHKPPLDRQLEQPRPAVLFNPKPPEPPRGRMRRHSPDEDRPTSYIPPPADMSASCYRSSESYSPPANRAHRQGRQQGRQLPTLLTRNHYQTKHEAAAVKSPATPGPVINPMLFNRNCSGSQSPPMAAGGPGAHPQIFKSPGSHRIPIQAAAHGCIAIGQPCAGMHAMVGPPKYAMGRNHSCLPTPPRLLGAMPRNSSLNVPLYAMPCA